MPAKLHLILQDWTIDAANEWVPACPAWIIIRVAAGAGYWMNGRQVGQLNAGDGLILAFDQTTRLRASLLNPMKLQFFIVFPQYLGLLTVKEWHHLQGLPAGPPAFFLHLPAGDPLGQKLARLAGQSDGDGLCARCALLLFWAEVVADKVAPGRASGKSSAPASRLREKLRDMFRQMPEGELFGSSLPQLAERLNCSVRHFCRLFREEFGEPFRLHQVELRLLRARQLLAETDDSAASIARRCGYRHQGLFGGMFRKRFGMSPAECRRQLRNSPAKPAPAIKPLSARVLAKAGVVRSTRP